MPIAVEDGTGVSGAVAYASAATASGLLASRGLVTPAWTALGTTGQEALLVRAADLLNDARRHPWKGTVVTQGQAMAFPRSEIAFPAVLPLCNALYAVSLSAGVAYEAVSSALGNITSVALPGGLSVDFDPGGSSPDTNPGASPMIRHPTVDGLLYPYIMLPRDAEIGSSGGIVFVPLTVPVSTVVRPEYEV